MKNIWFLIVSILFALAGSGNDGQYGEDLQLLILSIYNKTSLIFQI